MQHITQNNFKEEVLNHKGVVLADFYAEWCGPCKMLTPMLNELESETTSSQVKFVKINVDENPELSSMFGVMSIPTVILFKDGKVAEKKIGIATKTAYIELIEQTKNSKPSNEEKEITIFTTQTCPYCHVAKSYLKERKVAYKEIDVSNDQAQAMRMIQKSGAMGVPQLWINNEVVIGFDRERIDMLLNT